jgi:Ran-binding protein 9/10
MPGCQSASWGYHGDDGMAYHDGDSKSYYGPTFSTGDIIGCCINFQERLIFYTRNGELLDVAFTEISFHAFEKSYKDDIFPMIGLLSPGDHVRVNFGKESFVFNITDYVRSTLNNLVEEL